MHYLPIFTFLSYFCYKNSSKFYRHIGVVTPLIIHHINKKVKGVDKKLFAK